MASQSDFTIDILIRYAVIDESPAIAFVLRQAFIEYEPLYTADGFAATTPTSDQIRERSNEGPVWLAIQNGENVGTVWLFSPLQEVRSSLPNC